MKESEQKQRIIWSLDLAFNLKNCKGLIFEEKIIKDFFQDLGQKIDKGGELIGIVNEFGGHDDNMKGLRVIHETQNALITAHLVLKTNDIYLNIHSCNGYRPSEVIDLVVSKLEPDNYSCQKIYRE